MKDRRGSGTGTATGWCMEPAVFWVDTVHNTSIMGVTGFYGSSERFSRYGPWLKQSYRLASPRVQREILTVWDMAETIISVASSQTGSSLHHQANPNRLLGPHRLHLFIYSLCVLPHQQPLQERRYLGVLTPLNTIPSRPSSRRLGEICHI
jgi:hypothetical protein